MSTGRWGRDCWQPFADTQQMETWGWSETTSAMPVSKTHVVMILLHTSKTACYYDTDERQCVTKLHRWNTKCYTNQRQYVLYVTKHRWNTACYYTTVSTLIKDSMFCMLQNTDERQHATQMKDSMLPYYTDQRQNVTMTHRWKHVTILHWSKTLLVLLHSSEEEEKKKEKKKGKKKNPAC